MANFFINIETGIEPSIAFNIFSILADKSCGEIVLGQTRYTKNGNAFKANYVLEMKKKTNEKLTKGLIRKLSKPKKEKRQKKFATQKEYQHNYYESVTKEKRRKARTEKNTR